MADAVIGEGGRGANRRTHPQSDPVVLDGSGLARSTSAVRLANERARGPWADRATTIGSRASSRQQRRRARTSIFTKGD